MNSTSRSSREVRIAARSPFRSSSRAGDGADPDAELLADDVGEARLAEPGRADEQDVVERLVPRRRRGQRDLELVLEPLLTDELVESPRPERAVEIVLAGILEHTGAGDAPSCRPPQSEAHPFLGRQLGSVSDRARSASTSE